MSSMMILGVLDNPYIRSVMMDIAASKNNHPIVSTIAQYVLFTFPLKIATSNNATDA